MQKINNLILYIIIRVLYIMKTETEVRINNMLIKL